MKTRADKQAWTNAENEFLDAEISKHFSPGSDVSIDDIIDNYLSHFNSTRNRVAIRSQIRRLTELHRDYRQVNQKYTTEEIKYLTDLIKLRKFTNVDIALAFDDMFSPQHFTGGHTQVSIISTIINIKKQLFNNPES